MKNIEQELKLQLTEREYNLILSDTDATSVLQRNYYFKADEHCMLRIRLKNGNYTLCYKVRTAGYDAINVSDETECALTKDVAENMLSNGIRAVDLKCLIGVEGEGVYRSVGSLDTYRTAFDYECWHLELDKNVYFDVTDYELECECDDVSSLKQLCEHLAYRYGIQLVPSLPKSQRFAERMKQHEK